MRKNAFTLIELLVVIAIIAILAAILFPVFAQARNQARQAACLSNLKQLGTGLMMYVQDYDENFPFWVGGCPAGSVGCVDAWGQPEGSGWWMNQSMPYVKNFGIHACPNDTRPFNTNQVGCQGCGWDFSVIPGSTANGTRPRQFYKSSYGINEYLVTGFTAQSSLNVPANTLLIADAIGPLMNDWDECGQWPPFGPTRVWYANAGNWGAWGSHRDYNRWKNFARHKEGEVIAYADGHAGFMPNQRWQTEIRNGGFCGNDGRRQNPVTSPNNNPF